MTLPDLFALGVLLTMSLLGLSRGLTRSILNLIAWGGAIAITWALREPVTNAATPYTQSPIVADIIGLAVPFGVSLVLLQLLFGSLVHYVHVVLPKRVDHFAGLPFGFALGALALAFIWIVLDELAPELAAHESVASSRTLPFVQAVARPVRGALESAIPSAFIGPEEQGATPDEEL